MTDDVLETHAPEFAPEENLLGRLGRSNVALFLGWFVLILILKWSTLTQPPVWDSSMSVFPAAITLAESNFDLGYLLDQPGYTDGGPNVHSLSLVTWFTAAIIALVGDTAALFPILHLAHFAIAAAAMTGIYRFAVPLLGPRFAVAASLIGLVFPIVLTQAGYLYLEFPLLATTVFALLAWARRDAVKATMWASLAVMIKGSGIIVGASLAALAFFDPRKEQRDVRFGLFVLLVPTAIVATTIPFLPGIEGPEIGDHLQLMVTFLALVPDLLLLILLFLWLSVVFRPWQRRTGPEGREDLDDGAQGRLISIAFLTLVFFGFYLVLPTMGVALSVLPRYYVQIAPFLIIGTTAIALRRFPQVLVVSVLLMLFGWFAMNRNGDFYPRNTITHFGLIERSGAYAELLQLQQQGVKTIEGLPPDVPVFYDQAVQYKFRYPLMGYSEGGMANGYSIRHEVPFREGELKDFPSEFFLLSEHLLLGGDTIYSVWEQATADPKRLVEVEQLCSAAFCSQLIHVTSVTDP